MFKQWPFDIGDRLQCIDKNNTMNHSVGDIITITFENAHYYKKWYYSKYKIPKKLDANNYW